MEYLSKIKLYDGTYSGDQVDAAISAALNPDSAPDSSHTANLITSAAVANALTGKLDFSSLKVFKSSTSGATTATVSFTGASRWVCLVVTQRPTTQSDFAGAYIVAGYSTNAASRRTQALMTADQITITHTTGGFTATATASTGFVIIVLWDSNDSATVTFT